MADKSRLGPELPEAEIANRCFSRQYHPQEHQRRIVDPEVFNKTIILLGLYLLTKRDKREISFFMISISVYQLYITNKDKIVRR